MTKIKVLGSGCAKCKKLFELTRQAVSDLGCKIEVEYITDVSKIIEMGVMSSPVLAIDNKPVAFGFVPNLEEIKELIKSGTIDASKSEKCSCGGKC